MIKILNFLFFLWFYSCGNKTIFLNKNQEEFNIPNTYKRASIYDFKFNQDTIFLNGIYYSGYIYELQPNSNDTLFINGYSRGVLHGLSMAWYLKNDPAKTPILKEKRYYKNGKKHGLQLSFYENGNKKIEFTAVDNFTNGELKEWDKNGQIFHLGNYINGHEDGVQKLWYSNGKIKANFIIKNGKRYGLLGTKNCSNVSDSIGI